MTLDDAERKLDDLMAWIARRMPSNGHLISRPTVGWMTRPSARVNGLYSGKEKKIFLNQFKALSDADVMIEETLPHEFAHHVCSTLFPDEKQAHGPKFRMVCEAMGIPGKAMTLAYTGLKQHRRLKASCPCGTVTAVTYTIARRISLEKKIHRCTHCKGEISLPMQFGMEREKSGESEKVLDVTTGGMVPSGA